MSTTTFQQFKVSALPGVLVANAIYYVAVAGNPDLVEVFVVNSTGTAARHVLNESDVSAMIAAAMSGGNQLTIVNDIAARDALLPLATAKWVYVIDATGDATVTTGGATYLYNPNTESWVKAAESESMDLVMSWANLTGKPTSTPAAIDATVAASHTHTNKAQIDKIGEDGGGNLLYNGALPVGRWETAAW